MAEEFYQISVMISGKLLDFNIENNSYNKYKTGTGTLLVNDGQNNQMFPITAGKELAEQLTELKGSFVEITGAVRNYRCNEEKYNVIRVYSVTEKENEEAPINSVQATCEVIGLMTKQSVHTNTTAKAAQVYLLTNEKYDKHTRLNAVIFGTPCMPLSLDKLPALGKLYHFKGYLQLDRANQKPVQVDNSNTQTVEGKLELVVTGYEEVNNDSRKGNGD